jgi:hypothetical protein
MIDSTNLIGRGKPLQSGISRRGYFRAAAASVTASVTGWLASSAHRAGLRVFARTDAEARWQGWQIIERHGGLSRRYRDRRFDTWTRDTPAPDTAAKDRPIRHSCAEGGDLR